MNTKETIGYACGKCGSQFFDKGVAERCCIKFDCPRCEKTTDFVEGVMCYSCTEDTSLERAEIVDEWKGMLYLNGNYYDGVEDIEQEYEENDFPIPEFVFCTTSKTFWVDPRDILENALEEHHEDAFSHLDDVKEFEEFVLGWVSKQTLTTYYPDFKKKISTADAFVSSNVAQ